MRVTALTRTTATSTSGKEAVLVRAILLTTPKKRWKAMYLNEMRDALPLNVNPYLQLVDDARTKDACVRAASLLESTMRFRDALRSETLEPDIFHMGTKAQQAWFKRLVLLVPQRWAYYAAYAVKSYPLDMSQYPWLFNTSRQPGVEGDTLFTDSSASHVAVMAHNRVWALETHSSQGNTFVSFESTLFSPLLLTLLLKKVNHWSKRRCWKDSAGLPLRSRRLRWEWELSRRSIAINGLLLVLVWCTQTNSR